MTYKLGAVKPWVKAAAYELGPAHGVATIHGWGRRPNVTDHDDGLALDFMTRKGQGLADRARRDARRLGVTYVIWNQRIWSVARNGEGWRQMGDRGSDTANHRDHVHVSFAGSPPPGFIRGGSSSKPGGTQQQAVGQPTATSAGLIPDVLPEELTEGAQRLAIYGAAIGLGVLLIGIGAATTIRHGQQESLGKFRDTIKETIT